MSMDDNLPRATGRGAQIHPPNRCVAVHREADFEQFEYDDEYLESLTRLPTEYLADTSRTIVATNDSPDIPFKFSVNPYRGCSHGCA